MDQRENNAFINIPLHTASQIVCCSGFTSSLIPHPSSVDQPWVYCHVITIVINPRGTSMCFLVKHALLHCLVWWLGRGTDSRVQALCTTAGPSIEVINPLHSASPAVADFAKEKQKAHHTPI